MHQPDVGSVASAIALPLSADVRVLRDPREPLAAGVERCPRAEWDRKPPSQAPSGIHGVELMLAKQRGGAVAEEQQSALSGPVVEDLSGGMMGETRRLPAARRNRVEI